MRILIIGSGGREHALAWKFGQSPSVREIFTAPGNGGTAIEGTNVPIKDSDIPGILDFVRERKIDLVVVGPELPLTLGITDELERIGVSCFGPSDFAAQLEGSKAFAKILMSETGVPTADFEVFEDFSDAEKYIKDRGGPLVVKADGLAAGKGVFVVRTTDEALSAASKIMKDKIFGSAGERLLVEETLVGEEASLLVFCDGETVIPLASAQDHKAIFDNDLGPNTGGMGAYSPAPILPDEEAMRISDLTVKPIVNRLAELGRPFRGVLYAGLMMTADGPKVLEYNVRFGDPECQPLLMRMESDLAEIALSCTSNTLGNVRPKWRRETAVCVVMAANGYPGDYPRGMEITGIEAAEASGQVKVFHAGTRISDGRILSSGGRVLGVTALGDDLKTAQANAYTAVEKIRFENACWRKDIGDKGVRRLLALR